jgi:hypothetical protein
MMNAQNRTNTRKISNSKKQKRGFETLGTLFDRFEVKESKGYISQEFQDYGYRLAVELGDLKHKGLYMKLAKQEPRGLLDQARSFVIDSHARNKGALFMWKLKELKKEKVKAKEAQESPI